MAMRQKYIATMVMAGVGDALGYYCGSWEFNFSGKNIHSEVEMLGGLSKLKNEKPDFIVSDDTVMHLATARALTTKSSAKSKENLYDNIAHEYIRCMNDMSGRGPGMTCMGSCNKLAQLRAADPKAYRIPFNASGGGCGGSMRSMCIGLRYPQPDDLDDLIAVSIESGRMTHHHPTGYLGSLVSALFTAYAIQGKPVVRWGSEMVEQVLPLAKTYIENTGVDVAQNLNAWIMFEENWRSYLALREITEPSDDTVPKYPEDWGVEARDRYYSSISYSGWGGASGDDSTIISYDALLGSKGDWDELCLRGVFHGGDSDSTGSIASCWFGAMYGMENVYKKNHKKVEYREQMVDLAERIYELRYPSDPIDDKQEKRQQ